MKSSVTFTCFVQSVQARHWEITFFSERIVFKLIVPVLYHVFLIFHSFRAKHQHLPAAFGRDLLASERWLLGSSSATSEGQWREILQVDAWKQELFLERVLFVHRIAISRTSSSTQCVRLALQQWEREMDLACLAGFVLKSMKEARDEENAGVAMFEEPSLNMVRTRFVEGTLV